MNHKSGTGGDISIEEGSSLSCSDEQGARPKYETLSPEAFLERARNADRILENCRKSLKGV